MDAAEADTAIARAHAARERARTLGTALADLEAKKRRRKISVVRDHGHAPDRSRRHHHDAAGPDADSETTPTAQDPIAKAILLLSYRFAVSEEKSAGVMLDFSRILRVSIDTVVHLVVADLTGVVPLFGSFE